MTLRDKLIRLHSGQHAHQREHQFACQSRLASSSGFTLIELILVMAILTIAVSITAPTLANFFRGRTLDYEARQLLSLTRQAQSRAVSEGVPMELWVDDSQNSYGIEAEPSYEPDDQKKETFSLDKNVEIKVVSLNIGASRANGSFGARSDSTVNVVASHHPNLPKIRFMPDGSISEESFQIATLTGSDGSSISLILARSRLTYELQSRGN
jgi:type II secretion system protein H